MLDLSSISPCGESGLIGADKYFKEDCQDLMQGAVYVPTEVRDARVRGEKVNFVKDCPNPNCWYWLFSDGLRIYHFEHDALLTLAKRNGRLEAGKPFCGDPGPCPDCGNVHTCGGSFRD